LLIRRGILLGAALLGWGQQVLVRAQQPYYIQPREIRFAAAANGPQPASQAVVVASTLPATGLEAVLDGGSPVYPAPDSIAVSPRQAVTPARFTVSVTRTNLSAGTYTARLVIRTRGSIASLVLATVPITLVVTERPPALVTIPAGLRFLLRPGRLTSDQPLLVRNAGSGGLDCGSIRVAASERWVNARAETAAGACRVHVVVTAADLRAGAYRGSIRLSTGIGEADVPVALLVARAGPILGLNPHGFQFQAREDNGNAIRRNLSVLNIGEGTFNWTARILDPEQSPWLSISASSGTATPAAAGTIPVTVNPDGVRPGIYSALILISSAQAANSPQLLSVVFQVMAATEPPQGTPSPSGLFFSRTARSGVSEPQALSLFTSSRTPIPFQAAAQSSDGGNWLAIQPQSGSFSTGSPGSISVTVTAGTLAPGIYQGEVNIVAIVAGNLRVRTVNVTMIVRPSASAAASSVEDESMQSKQAASCVPGRLSATHTGLVSNFSTNVGWPTPINVRLANDCGDPVTDGQVILSFSNGDPPVALSNLGNGSYAGTWTPRKAAEESLTILAEAFAGSFRASIELIGSVQPNVAPILAPDGILNNLFPRLGGPLAPGMIVQIFGTDLAGGQAQPPLAGGRLPDTFNNVTVLIGAQRAPLYFLSPGQINAQIPFELQPGQQYPVVVRSGGGLSVPELISVASVQPGIAAFPGGRGIAQDENFQLLTDANPARRGRPIVIYLVGMGATSPEVPSGGPAPAATLARVTELPVVTIDGKTARNFFAGLTPGFVGLYQMNIEVPGDAATGLRPLVVTQGNVASNGVLVPIQ
jgi:uncharacterized protein (TIGR03437 family)